MLGNGGELLEFLQWAFTATHVKKAPCFRILMVEIGNKLSEDPGLVGCISLRLPTSSACSYHN